MEIKDKHLSQIGYEALTLAELKDVVPAAFMKQPHVLTTKHYSFVNSEDLIKAIMKLGWEIRSGKQNGPDRYARHMIRFVHPKMGYMKEIDKDNVEPQIILDNSHNRISSTQIHMGLFRLVCSNGLVVSIPGMSTAFKFRHMGVDMKELTQALELAAEQYKTIGDHVADMQDVAMTDEMTKNFAISAIAKREPHLFLNKDKTINSELILKSVDMNEITSPVRGEDKAGNLWTVFNVLQERLVNGGYGRVTPSGRNAVARGISSATRNIVFNKEIWQIAEDIMVPPTKKIEIVQA